MDIKLDLKNHEDIPKIIHISWKNKNILDSNSDLIINGLANMKKINPEYIIEISDDNDVDNYLKQKIGINEYELIKDKKIVEKVDLWRLLKIYIEGGIYVDLDRYCNIPFKDIITKDIKCILPTYFDLDFSQDLLISCKNNPIFYRAIQYNFLGRKKGMKLYDLGAPMYMFAVTEIIFGKRIYRNSGFNQMEELRQALHESKHFLTYKEEPMNNTLIFRNKNISNDHMIKSKSIFYMEQKVIPWYIN